MTTASTLGFSAMDVPLDDTMEMGSPYQGHADDFDIDLDVMEDQVSNVDEDLMVADASPEPSRGAEYVNDADMTDDIAERAMVDAGDQHETNHIGVQYEETYEAQMLEDDYDEDIDAPVPDPYGGASKSFEATGSVNIEAKIELAENHGLVEQHEEVESHPREAHFDEHDSQEPRWEAEQRDVHHVEETAEKADNEQNSSEPEPNHHDDTNETVREDVQPGHTVETEDNAVQVEQHEDEGLEAGEAPAQVNKLENKEPEPTEAQNVQNLGDQKTSAVQAEQIDSHLHPVKVLYQDNEISLFPPREGDPSETFFIEDEDLAYDNLGKLFKACREVLQDHIGETDILVMDVDSLNIQLTEDSFHLPQVTLHQLVDLYLHLCHNDGIDEPEPLYITLSTKPSIPAELSDLLAAANEGKGLSHIHSWDDYEETEPVLAESDQEQQGQELDQEVLRQDSLPGEDAQNEHDSELPVEENDSGEHRHEIEREYSREEEFDLETKNAENPASNQGEEAAPSTTHPAEDNEHENVYQTEHDPEANDYPEQEDARGQSPADEGSYESEAQKSESTATLAHASAPYLEQEEYQGGSAEISSHHDQLQDDHVEVDEGDESYYEEVEGEEENGEEEQEEGEEEEGEEEEGEEGEVEEEVDDDDVSNSGIDFETSKYDAVQGINDEDPDLEDPKAHLPSEHDDQEQADEDEKDVDSYENEESTTEALQADADVALQYDTEVQLESVPMNQPEGKEGATPEPTDDFLDMAEDLFRSPMKDPSNLTGVQTEETESRPQPGDHDVTEHPSAEDAPNGEAEDLTFDDEDDYLDLGITDGLGVGSAEPPVTDTQAQLNASTKRSREEDDELQSAEVSTPDIKRSRSS